MKRCLYCPHWHEQKGRCCSEWCARRMNGHFGAVTRGRNAAVTKLRDEAVRRGTNRSHFRHVAMGDDLDAHLSAVFGVQLTLAGLPPVFDSAA